MEYIPWFFGKLRTFMTSQSLLVLSCEICHWVTGYCVVLDQTLFLEDRNPLNAKDWNCFMWIYKLICSCFSSKKQPIATSLAGFQIWQKSHSVFWFFSLPSWIPHPLHQRGSKQELEECLLKGRTSRVESILAPTLFICTCLAKVFESQESS